MKKLILTVCGGNMHRSVIAAAYINKMITTRCLQSRYEVCSRGIAGTMGTDPPEHNNLRDYPEWLLTKPYLDKIGVEIPSSQRSTPIDRGIVDRASLVLAMDRLVLSSKPNSLQNQFPDLKSKMLLFSELAGTTEDVLDVHGITDTEIHRRSVDTIHSVLDQHFDDLLSLVDQIR